MIAVRDHDAAHFVLAFVRYARWRAAIAALLIALGGVFEGVGLLLLVPLLGVVMGQRPTASWPIPMPGGLSAHGQPAGLIVLLALFALAMMIRAMVLVLRDRTIGRLQLGFVETMRTRLIAGLAATGWQTVARLSHARIVQALGLEMHQVGIAANALLLASVALMMLIGSCALALFLAPLAGALALVFAVLAALVSRPFMRRAQALGRTITDAHFGMMQGALQFLSGLKLAKAQGLQGAFIADYGGAASAAMRDRLSSMTLQTMLGNVTTMLAATIGAVTVFAGVVLFHLPSAVLVALLLVLARMGSPAMVLQRNLQTLLYGLPAYRAVHRLEQQLAQGEPANDSGVAGTGRLGNGPVVLRGVTFRYPSGGGVETVNLTIPAGAFVGIVGPSGAGKTTFLDVVAGILPAEAGTIMIGGRTLDGSTLAQHRAQLAYVGQEPFLFDDSVRRNLSWSHPDASAEEMWAAIEMVGAAAIVRRGAQGLDMPVGQHGVRLSAGERQRLALARALLRQPKLLLLDEATNAIDVAAERSILERLAAMTPAVTILMVTHRPQNLDLCDHVMTFPELSLERLRPAPRRMASR